MRLAKLSQRGFGHIIIPLIVVSLVAVIGTFLLVMSHADTPASSPDSCTPTACGTPPKPDLHNLTSYGPKMGHGSMSRINVLAIHFTASNQAGADLAQSLIAEGDGIQFNIDRGGKVYNYFPLNGMKETYQIGRINDHAIGIEITGVNGDALLSDHAQFNSVVKTVRYLCYYYAIPCKNPKSDVDGYYKDPNKAQGLIGHDEAPNPGNTSLDYNADHADPDIRLNGLTPINISTGKPWTNADRCSSATHAYMKALRKALGYDATPGGAASTLHACQKYFNDGNS